MHVEAVVESKGEGKKENKITLLYQVLDGELQDPTAIVGVTFADE